MFPSHEVSQCFPVTITPGKITDITNKTGSTYWKNQYVLGDYEIIEQEPQGEETIIETIEIGGIKYDKKEVEDKLKDIKPVN